MLGAGQASDGYATLDLLDALPSGCKVLADRADDSKTVCSLIAGQGAVAIVPSMPQRNTVIRTGTESKLFFNKIKNFRASVQLASTRIWLRSYERVP